MRGLQDVLLGCTCVYCALQTGCRRSLNVDSDGHPRLAQTWYRKHEPCMWRSGCKRARHAQVVLQ